ncbi:hypothetical protein GCM10007298_08950 [Williamsia phyllosphaerae]|uniref:Uncharacterized protein n=1 Tax=Williamsia phyllosphaerae TaxID=885042 RepID=A0ABQ1UE17_9NOCA|nr:hypothetical protein GCM10007298_08950 [Williamsia phyllosphaerae]
MRPTSPKIANPTKYRCAMREVVGTGARRIAAIATACTTSTAIAQVTEGTPRGPDGLPSRRLEQIANSRVFPAKTSLIGRCSERIEWWFTIHT